MRRLSIFAKARREGKQLAASSSWNQPLCGPSIQPKPAKNISWPSNWGGGHYFWSGGGANSTPIEEVRLTQVCEAASKGEQGGGPLSTCCTSPSSIQRKWDAPESSLVHLRCQLFVRPFALPKTRSSSSHPQACQETTNWPNRFKPQATDSGMSTMFSVILQRAENAFNPAFATAVLRSDRLEFIFIQRYVSGILNELAITS